MSSRRRRSRYTPPREESPAARSRRRLQQRFADALADRVGEELGGAVAEATLAARLTCSPAQRRELSEAGEAGEAAVAAYVAAGGDGEAVVRWAHAEATRLLLGGADLGAMVAYARRQFDATDVTERVQGLALVALLSAIARAGDA